MIRFSELAYQVVRLLFISHNMLYVNTNSKAKFGASQGVHARIIVFLWRLEISIRSEKGWSRIRPSRLDPLLQGIIFQMNCTI